LKPILALAALFTGAAFAAAPPRAAPPPKYCRAVAFRDYEVLIGRAALVRPANDCTLGSLIRKVSDLNGAIYDPVYVPPNIVTLYRPKIWLFASHLEYSLDGEAWLRLRLIP